MNNIKDTELRTIIKTKKTNLILSLDIVDEKTFFQILAKCVNLICGIKIHSDILPFAHNPQFYSKLIEFATIYKFIIIEDRKLSDVGYINKLQAQHYKNYGINYMTCHSIMGRDAIDAIDCGLKLFLVADMSCKGAVIDDNICHDMFIENNNIIGFVSQKQHTNSKFTHQPLYLQPGIKIDGDNDTDAYGQQYNIPKVRPGVLWVVGRDITTAKDPYKQALKYQQFFELAE
jgi:orotidine-5'-phosphate decarboxylase